MIEQISLRLFILFMLLCGSSAIVLIWLEPVNESIYKIIPTFFIIGFASLLIWGVQMVYRFVRVVEG